MATPAAPDKSRFIQDVTIRNFKCFEELKMEGCGQFNLIVGDNNVGKTSVLEALLVDESWDLENVVIARLQRVRLDKYGSFPNNVVTQDEPLNGLVEVFARNADTARGFTIGFKRRGIEDWPPFIMYLKPMRELDESAKHIVRLNRIRGQHVIWMKHGDEHVGGFTALNEPLYTGLNLPFISLKSLYGPDLIEAYSQTITPSTTAKEQFVAALTGMIPSLTDVELTIDPVLGPQIIARLADQDRAQPLAFFGDGSVKVARILLQIPPVANDRLMIDEIDAGIHYSRFTTLWRTTLKAAIDNNVQLFITTHNVECLRALAQVLATDEFADYREECCSFTLEKLPDGNVKAFRYNYSQFEYAINAEMELRGRYL